MDKTTKIGIAIGTGGVAMLLLLGTVAAISLARQGAPEPVEPAQPAIPVTPATAVTVPPADVPPGDVTRCGPVMVNGYVRKDGRFVAPYSRSAPGRGRR